jgi:RecB family exonuclease
VSGKPKYLAPSDLSYLYDRCPRCYWLKLRGFVGPDDKLPGVFRDIDRAQKQGITIEAVREMGIPATEFIGRDKVASVPETFGGTLLAISGYTDRRVRLEDGTLGIIDFKTSHPKVEHMARFWRAMSAYQYAIEHSQQPEEVTLLALLVFTPVTFKTSPKDVRSVAYTGQLTRIDVDIDRPKFVKLLENIGTMLACEDMPAAGACDTCRHADQVASMKMNALLHKIATHPELGPDFAAAIAARIQL